MNIELRHLRYFIAVAEESSFTGAARRMHVAQQVLSAQVRQLEGTLGVQLLERTSKGAALTPAGAAFLETARDTLASLDRAVAAARNAARAVTGELTVGLSVAAGGELPTALLAAFGAVEQQVEVRLRTFELDQPAACWTAAPTCPLSGPRWPRPASGSGRSRRSPGCSCCRRATRWPGGRA